jgi:hypothetical protein
MSGHPIVASCSLEQEGPVDPSLGAPEGTRVGARMVELWYTQAAMTDDASRSECERDHGRWAPGPPDDTAN